MSACVGRDVFSPAVLDGPFGVLGKIVGLPTVYVTTGCDDRTGEENPMNSCLNSAKRLVVLLALFAVAAVAQTALPFPPKPSGSIAGRTMQESIYSPLPAVRAICPRTRRTSLSCSSMTLVPGLPDTYGGEIHTPTLSRIASGGISYNRFHTTAMCSPTRAALLTGRNHQRVSAGQIAELANDWDGYSGVQPKSERHGGGGPKGLRLQHWRMGQVAQHTGGANDCCRAVRLLADRLRL